MDTTKLKNKLESLNEFTNHEANHYVIIHADGSGSICYDGFSGVYSGAQNEVLFSFDSIEELDYYISQ